MLQNHVGHRFRVARLLAEKWRLVARQLVDHGRRAWTHGLKDKADVLTIGTGQLEAVGKLHNVVRQVVGFRYF